MQTQAVRSAIDTALISYELMMEAGIQPSELKNLADLRKAVSQIIVPSPRLAIPAFEKVSDEVVLDRSTGLMWDARAPQAANNWNHAKELASKVSLLGHSDWYLPSRRELITLIDDTRCEPAINTDFFLNTPTNDWYWTSTPYASSPSVYAWYVSFGYGYVGDGGQNGSGFVRACRRVSPGLF